jgi:hypothetical protein
MSVDPYVVRSQRNRRRQPVTEAALSEKHTENELRRVPTGIGHGTRSKLRMVQSKQHMGYFSLTYFLATTLDSDEILTTSRGLIFNRVLGGGIFVTPPLVLALVGDKSIALVLWVIGGIIQLAGYVYIFVQAGFQD